MKKTYSVQGADEPIGIIISTGSREEPVPAFAAFIWAPAPEPIDESSRAA